MTKTNKKEYTKLFKLISGISTAILMVASLATVTYPDQAHAGAGDGTGGTITYSGPYTIHTFTSGGTFNPGPYISTVEVLIVGGGGGGGGVIGGGGGGGGIVATGGVSVTPSANYTVTVGAGGAGGKGWQGDAGATHVGSNGGNSSVFGLTSFGGGGGSSSVAGGTGGSGGGAGFNIWTGSAGTAGQGNNGGNSSDPGNKGAGGGGFGGVGGSAYEQSVSDGSCASGSPGAGWVCVGGGWLPPGYPTLGRGGIGANGAGNSTSGTNVVYGGGGGGGVRSGYGNGGAGGVGGGGAGSNVTTGAGNGTNGLGGGGGGAGYNGDTGSLVGGVGGSGIVIIRYATFTPPTPTCGNATPDGDWTIANAGTRQAFANGVANATDVYFPTWSGTTGGEQDDIVWYHLGQGAYNLGGGTWRADINLASHPGLGTISTHVYLYSPASSYVWCDSANAVRLNNGTVQVNSNSATTWTLTCDVSNPVCPNANQGTPTTSQSFTGKPYGNWTLTPAAKPGYDYQVDGCALNTPCTKPLN